jgi:hypothetical protein
VSVGRSLDYCGKHLGELDAADRPRKRIAVGSVCYADLFGGFGMPRGQ